MTSAKAKNSKKSGAEEDSKREDRSYHEPHARFTFSTGRISGSIALLGAVLSIVYLWFKTSLTESLETDERLLVSNVVTIHTEFSPLDPAAFSSFIDSEESRRSLYGVLSWKTAAVSWAWVQCSMLASLLPPDGISTAVGKTWRLLSEVNSQDVMLSSKYVAPPPAGPVEELLHQLLSVFHPQPFLYSRYGPRGAVAILRAKTNDSLDVIFRLHAEYQLNIPPRRPLWFTPAAHIGRLVINTTDLAVKHFSLSVPTDKLLNVDLEWLIGPNEDKDMEVTITHIPKMKLVTETSEVDGLTWQYEITQAKALALLQKELYRFQQVEYHNFTEAYIKGSNESKPVHTIVLWGVLDDQSC